MKGKSEETDIVIETREWHVSAAYKLRQTKKYKRKEARIQSASLHDARLWVDI
jgi:hypothetical protein